MTDPIAPPPELVQQWCHEDGDEIKTSPRWFHSVCAKAAQWGAEQELEACVKLANEMLQDGDSLRAARRPKPPSLKEQALAALREACEMANDRPPEGISNYQIDIIRRALEALDD